MNTFLVARKSIRFVASSLRGFVALDDLLGEAGTIEKAIAAGQAELAGIEVKKQEATAAIGAAEQAAADYMVMARTDAETLRVEAEQTLAAANERRIEVDRLCVDAKAEAAALVERGREHARAAALDADGRLGALRKEMAAAEEARATIAAETSALTAQRDSIAAELAAMKRRFG